MTPKEKQPAQDSEIYDSLEAITNPARITEENKLAKRVCGSRRQAMEWLLRFAQADLQGLSKGQLIDLRAELTLFLLNGPPAPSRGSFSFHVVHAKAASAGERTEAQKESAEGLGPLQDTVKALLNDFLRNGYAALPPIENATYHVVLSDPQRPVKFRRAQVQLWAQNFRDIFTYHLADLLGEHSGRIRECQECKRVFLALREKQELCSRRCLNRVNQRKFQKRKKEKAGRGRSKRGKENN